MLVVDRAEAPTAHDEIEAYCAAAGARPRWITHAAVQVERVLDQVALGTGHRVAQRLAGRAGRRRPDVAVRPLRPVALFDAFQRRVASGRHVPRRRPSSCRRSIDRACDRHRPAMSTHRVPRSRVTRTSSGSSWRRAPLRFAAVLAESYGSWTASGSRGMLNPPAQPIVWSGRDDVGVGIDQGIEAGRHHFFEPPPRRSRCSIGSLRRASTGLTTTTLNERRVPPNHLALA